jgi:Zn-dependent peptidase ImmA (M78 family)
MSARRRKPKFGAAVRKARDVLEQCKIVSAPVDVHAIALQLGVDVRSEAFDGGLSGMAYRTPDRKSVIGVNANHTVPRQRFTVAHELGHLQLDHASDVYVDAGFPVIGFRSEVSGAGVDPDEVEANQFAAELLMPEAFLRADLDGKLLDMDAAEQVGDLAEKYQVSVQAMTIRLTKFGLIE